MLLRGLEKRQHHLRPQIPLPQGILLSSRRLTDKLLLHLHQDMAILHTGNGSLRRSKQSRIIFNFCWGTVY